MYAVLVVGCIQLSFSANMLFETCDRLLILLYQFMTMRTYILDRRGSSAGLELEEDDVRDAHFESEEPSDWDFGWCWRRSKERCKGVNGCR